MREQACIIDINMTLLCLSFLSSSYMDGMFYGLVFYEIFLIAWHCVNSIREYNRRFQNHKIHVFLNIINALDELYIYISHFLNMTIFKILSDILIWIYMILGDSGISELREICFM